MDLSKIGVVAIAAAVAGGAWWWLQPAGTAIASDAQEGDPIVEVVLPESMSAQAQMGKAGFEQVCAACHGVNAVGSVGKGPPLVHIVYEPGHHGDFAFHRAVEQGVRAHHWPFGDMPPQKGLTKADVDAIVAYVRELQVANGID